MFDGIGATGEHHFPEETFQLLLDGVCDCHFIRIFFLKCFIASSSQQYAVPEIPEIVKPFLIMEGAFEREPVNRGGDQHLSSRRRNVQLRQQLPGKGIRTDQ